MNGFNDPTASIGIEEKSHQVSHGDGVGISFQALILLDFTAQYAGILFRPGLHGIISAESLNYFSLHKFSPQLKKN